MRQQVTVTRLVDAQYAEVMLKRQSACSGDCHKCGGCATPNEVICVRAVNAVGAKPGDAVIVETSTGAILKAAMLVYLVPILLFFMGWAIGTAIGAAGICGAVGFVLGLVPAILYNRYLSRRPVRYTITSFV